MLKKLEQNELLGDLFVLIVTMLIGYSIVVAVICTAITLKGTTVRRVLKHRQPKVVTEQQQPEGLSQEELQAMLDAENAALDLEQRKAAMRDVGDAEIMDSMKETYNENNDMIGWLTIGGTTIDYPVMQTPLDEEYYLKKGFDGRFSAGGCLIMDTDSNVGSGTIDVDYSNGSRPSTNLLIHGHHMKNKTMFGTLDSYKDIGFYEEHKLINFASLYEEREYEVVCAFYSEVFDVNEDVFKFYKFFQANTEEEFNYYIENIKKLQIYDTGVTPVFGDELLTLTTCAYQTDNGRFVVVARRTK